MQLIVCIYLILFLLSYFVTSQIVLPQILTAWYVRTSLMEALKEEKGKGCEMPFIDPFSKEAMDFDKKYPPFLCYGLDWVRCYLSTCKLDSLIKHMYKYIVCTYKEIIYDNDFEYHFGPGISVSGDQAFHFNNSDHAFVYCHGLKPNIYKMIQWQNLVAGFRPLSAPTPPQGRRKSYNILIFAFDSASKNGFIRKMPHSYKFIKNDLKSTILNSYNIVGDGTTAAVVPILTGRTELELPECRKAVNESGFTDSFPLLFYTLRDDGYRTAYFEDCPRGGTFQLRLKGFRHQPADHYLRPFFMELQKNKNFHHDDYCVGDTPQYKLMMNLTDQFFQLDGKKFAFTFIADISHDNFNLITNADKPLVEFLKGLQENGFFEKTLVIIMGDHGSRFSNLRKTLQGKLEERLPMMAIRLPDDLVKKRPEAQKALEMNSNVLTTPHDIHATILDVINLKEHWVPFKVKGADYYRSLTLLKPIPKNRSCSEAGVEPHWCACLKWQSVSKDDPTYQMAAEALLNQINFMTAPQRHKCAYRSLVSIDWVLKKAPNKQVLSFQEARDSDGYIASFHDSKMQLDNQLYQVKVTLEPGMSVYEGTVTYLVNENKFIVNHRDISRTNAYSKEPACITKELPHLNPYCYCYEKLGYQYI